MYKKLLLPIIGAVIVILLLGFQAVEHWTVIEHVLEALKQQGPVGLFLSGVITSPILALVLALLTLAISFEARRQWQEKNKEEASNAIPAKSDSPVSDKSSTATATGGNVTLQFPIMPPAQVPIPSPPQKEIFPAIDVELIPWEGPSEKMFLTVKNRGPKQGFQAQCRVLARRNDPNPQQKMTFNLN